MAKSGAEARSLETGPEQQPRTQDAALEGAKKAEMEKGIADVHGIMTKATPEQMVAAPAALETLPAMEPGKWEKVKGWASGIVGKMREAFKQPVPPTLEQIHDQQVVFIDDFLQKNSTISVEDRKSLQEVIMNQIDANEKDPKVIAERMKLVLSDHQARMKQMDEVAKAMQKAVSSELKLDIAKTEELAGEMLKVDPATRDAIAKVYGLLGTLKPDMKNPDAKAKMEFDLLTNPKALADFLRARIPGGKAVTDIQIESLARTVALTIETQNALDRQEAAKQKEEQEKQNKLRIEKMKRVAYFVNKYPRVEEPKDNEIDAFLQKMEVVEADQQKIVEGEKKIKEASEAEKNAKMAEIGKVVIEGRRTMNLDNVIGNLNLLAVNKNFDKDLMLVFNELTMGQRIIANELVTMSKDGELKLAADPKSAVSNLLFRLDTKLSAAGLKLPEDAKTALGSLLQHEVTRIYQEKAAKQAESIPESQLGKKQTIEFLQAQRGAIESVKTDRLRSIETLLSANQKPEQQKFLEERRKEMDAMLVLDDEYKKLAAQGWAETGPDGKRRMTSKGLIGYENPNWSVISPEQRGKIEELQNETMDLDKKLLANRDRIRTVQWAYNDVEDLKNAKDAKEKGIQIGKEVMVTRTDGRIVKGIVNNIGRNEKGDVDVLVSFAGDQPGSYGSKRVTLDQLAQWQKEQTMEELPSDLLQEEQPEVKVTPPPIPEAAKRKPRTTIPPPSPEALKLMKKKAPEAAKGTEPLAEEASRVRMKAGAPETAAESEKDKMVKQALDKLNTSKSYGVGRLAEDIRNLGDKTDNVAANDLMQLNEELTTLVHRAGGYIEGEPEHAGEDVIDEKTIEPILTGIDEVLSVYSPKVSKAAQDKVKNMVAEHNRKVEAEIAQEQNPTEPPMEEAA